jgi:hypothetical protein
LQPLYKIIKEGEWDYFFVTKHGIKYHAYFIDASIYHPLFSNVYAFNIEAETATPHPIDNGIAATIVSILKVFFLNEDRAIILVCDTTDGKEKKREKLFSKWFIRHNDGSLIKYDASIKTENYLLYVSMLLKVSNPQREMLLTTFSEIVSNSFYPID